MSEASLPLRQAGSLAVPLRLLSDDRLAGMAAQGSSRAFTAIYERHHQGLYRYCRSILLNSEDASDALQNSMTSAFEALAGETREIKLKPWLYRIAHNEAISMLRRRREHRDVEAAADVAGPSIERRLEGNARIRQLVDDLQDLPERQRGALVMRELSGLSYEEIAVAMEVSGAAAKQAVYEARTALHELNEGREMLCEDVRQTISANDGRLLRGRKLRAHLRACESCRDFQATMKARQHDLAALAPPIPAGAAGALLAAILGTFGGGGGGGVAALAGGAAWKALGSSPAIKAAAAGMAALAVGGAASVVEQTHVVSHPHPQTVARHARPHHPHHVALADTAAASHEPSQHSSGSVRLTSAPKPGPVHRVAHTAPHHSAPVVDPVTPPPAQPVSAPAPAPTAPARPAPSPSPTRPSIWPIPQQSDAQTTSTQQQLIQSWADRFAQQVSGTLTTAQQQFLSSMIGSSHLPTGTNWSTLMNQFLSGGR